MQKYIIVISGQPGCGKSMISEAIAKEFSLPIFSVDPIEAAIVRSGIPQSFETGLAAYVTAKTLAKEQLKLGTSVVIDAVNGVNQAKEMWRELSHELDAKLVLIQCSCSDEQLQRSRIENRRRDIEGIPEITWDGVLKAKEEFTKWDEPKLELDAVNRAEDNINKAIEYIAKNTSLKSVS